MELILYINGQRVDSLTTVRRIAEPILDTHRPENLFIGSERFGIDPFVGHLTYIAVENRPNFDVDLLFRAGRRNHRSTGSGSYDLAQRAGVAERGDQADSEPGEGANAHGEH